MKDKQIGFRIHQDIYNEYFEIIKELKMSVSDSLRDFILFVVNSRKKDREKGKINEV